MRRQASDNINAITNFNTWNLAKTYQISLTPPAMLARKQEEDDQNQVPVSKVEKAEDDYVKYIRKGMPSYVS